MGKARAQQFSQTRTLHRRRRPRGARDRTRLRRCHAVLSHRRRTALPRPPKQQQQLWQRIFASLVRAAASSQSGGRLPRGPGGRASCDRGRGGLARAGASLRRAGKAACKGGAIGEAAALAPVQLTRQPPVPSGGLCAAGLSIHTSDDLPRPDSVQTASRQRPDSVQTASRQCPDSVQTAKSERLDSYTDSNST